MALDNCNGFNISKDRLPGMLPPTHTSSGLAPDSEEPLDAMSNSLEINKAGNVPNSNVEWNKNL